MGYGCKELIQLNSKASNPVEKWAKDLHRHFSKDNIHMAKRHVKTPLIISDMHITTTRRCLPTLIRMVVMLKTSNECW